MRHLGLRTKVMATFTIGALFISGAVAVLSYDLARSTLLASRQGSAVRGAYFDAKVVQAGLASDDPDVVAVLRSLDTGATRHDVIVRYGQPYSRTADGGITAAIPTPLRTLVATGQPQIQRVHTSIGPALVIGIPIDEGTQFYVVDSLRELDQTLRVLSLVLALVAAGTTAAGAAIGAYASRRVLRPLTRVTAAARDISAGDLRARLDPATEPDLAQLTSSFNHMVDQLAERIARDRRFAADVSHELRSPLQTLAAAVSVLDRRRGSLDERGSLAVELIVDEVTRFQDLVTDLLELARSDQPADLAPVDVADVARHLCRARKLPIDLVRVEAGTPEKWLLDRRRFEQIMANLLDNAIHHGGGPTAIRFATTTGIGTIDIDDEGPGVASTDRQTIFHRFVRGPSANARGDNNGTGLGLALVAEHVAAHGGTVRVLDRPGGGARFHIAIPLDTR